MARHCGLQPVDQSMVEIQLHNMALSHFRRVILCELTFISAAELQLQGSAVVRFEGAELINIVGITGELICRLKCALEVAVLDVLLWRRELSTMLILCGR